MFVLLCCPIKQDLDIHGSTFSISSPKCVDGYRQQNVTVFCDGLVHHSVGRNTTPSCFMSSETTARV